MSPANGIQRDRIATLRDRPPDSLRSRARDHGKAQL